MTDREEVLTEVAGIEEEARRGEFWESETILRLCRIIRELLEEGEK